MANPITWRNVAATSSMSGIGSLMEGAQASFDKGIGALDKILEQAKTTQQANWDQGKTNNNDQMMDSLYGYKSPEELANAQASGEFQRMMAGMGSQVDRAAFREALDSRGGVLQERAVANQGYQDHNARVGQRGLEAEAITALYNGDVAGFQERVGQMTIDQTKFLDQFRQYSQEEEADGRSDAQLAISRQNAANDATRLGFERSRLNMAQEEHNAKLGQLNVTNQGNALVLNTIEQVRAASDAAQQAERDVVQGSGLPLTESGDVDWSQIPEQQQPQVRAYLESNLKMLDAPTVPNLTQTRQEVVDGLTAMGMPIADQNTLVAELDNAFSIQSELAAPQQERLAERTSRIDAAYAPQMQALEERYQREVEQDPVVRSIVNPEDSTRELLEPFTQNFNPAMDYSPFGVSDARQFQEMQELVYDVSSEGLLANGQRFPVDPGTLGLALQQAKLLKESDSFWGVNLRDATERALRDIVLSPGYIERVERGGQIKAEYEAEKNALEIQRSGQIRAAEQDLLRRNGLIIPTR